MADAIGPHIDNSTTLKVYISPIPVLSSATQHVQAVTGARYAMINQLYTSQNMQGLPNFYTTMSPLIDLTNAPRSSITISYVGQTVAGVMTNAYQLYYIENVSATGFSIRKGDSGLSFGLMIIWLIP